MKKRLTFYLFTLTCALGVILTAVRSEPGLGSFTTFNVPGAGYTQARYINPRGEIVGFYFDGAGGTTHGFVRNTDGGFSSFDVPSTRSSRR